MVSKELLSTLMLHLGTKWKRLQYVEWPLITFIKIRNIHSHIVNGTIRNDIAVLGELQRFHELFLGMHKPSYLENGVLGKTHTVQYRGIFCMELKISHLIGLIHQSSLEVFDIL